MFRKKEKLEGSEGKKEQFIKNEQPDMDAEIAATSSTTSTPEKMEVAHMSELLSHFKRNEALSREILRSVKFIRSYYFWRWIFNLVKMGALVLVIVLGIVSWDSIVEFIRTSLNSYVGAQTPTQLDPATLQRLINN